jgi:hypothetical protein
VSISLDSAKKFVLFTEKAQSSRGKPITFRAKKVQVGGVTATPKTPLNKLLTDGLSLAERQQLHQEIGPDVCMAIEHTPEGNTALESALRIIKSERDVAAEDKTPSGTFLSHGVREDDFSMTYLVKDVLDATVVYLYAESGVGGKEVILSWDKNVLIPSLKGLMGEDSFKSWHDTNSRQCEFAYHPNKPRFYTSERGRAMFNTWAAPSWREGWDPTIRCDMPFEIVRLFEHVFPDELQRELVYDALADAVFGRRSKWIICIFGPPGRGKGTAICTFEALVGEDHYAVAPPSFTDSQFNSTIEGTQVVYLDEVPLNQELRKKLKSLHNEKASCELKGKEARTIEIHASFIISNNFDKDNYIEPNDRKFFFPDVSTAPPFDTEFYTDIKFNLLKDPEYLRRMASALYHRDTGGYVWPPKTKTFEMLCEQSMPDYQKDFISMCKGHKTFTKQDFAKRMGKSTRNTQNMSAIHRWLVQHHAHTGVMLAELSPTSSCSNWIAISNIYEGPTVDALTDHLGAN